MMSLSGFNTILVAAKISQISESVVISMNNYRKARGIITPGLFLYTSFYKNKHNTMELRRKGVENVHEMLNFECFCWKRKGGDYGQLWKVYYVVCENRIKNGGAKCSY